MSRTDLGVRVYCANCGTTIGYEADWVDDSSGVCLLDDDELCRRCQGSLTPEKTEADDGRDEVPGTDDGVRRGVCQG